MEATEQPHDDGPSDEEIGRGMQLADGLAEGLMTTVEALCSHPDETADFGAVVYGVWAWITRELLGMGWTPENLHADTQHMAADEASEPDEIGPTVGRA
jgi:hypothetical protein